MTRKDCPFTPDDLVAFAYGELEQERSMALAHHLESCTACRVQVLSLKQAAELSAVVRCAQTPEPRWTKGFDPVPSWWTRPMLIWAPVTMAAAVLVLLIIFGTSIEPSPTTKTKRSIHEPTPTKLAFGLVDAHGNIKLHGNGVTSETRPTTERGFYPGDTISSGKASLAKLSLPDGSRIVMGANSRLSLKSSDESGDGMFLHLGSVACQVTPRHDKRPFVVATSKARIEVVGTKFAVSVEKGRLKVGVRRGKVRVVPAGSNTTSVLVQARQQLALSSSGDVAQGELDSAMNELLDALGTYHKLSKTHKPSKSIQILPLAKPKAGEQSHDKMSNGPDARLAPAADKTPKPMPPAKAKSTAPPAESLETLVARLHKDTGWIFDDLRLAMGEGRCPEVLHKLGNYLSDPDSPRRDEALFLKGVCLERLGHKHKAARSYREYLNNWPRGNRAADCRAGIRRIWASSGSR